MARLARESTKDELIAAIRTSSSDASERSVGSGVISSSDAAERPQPLAEFLLEWRS